VDMGGESSGSGWAAGGGIEAGGNGSAGASIGAQIVASLHTLNGAHVVIAGADDLAPPTALLFASADLPADAVVVSGSLDLSLAVGVGAAEGASVALDGGAGMTGGVRDGIDANPVGVAGAGGHSGPRTRTRHGRGHGHSVAVVQADVPAPTTRAVHGGTLVLEAPDGSQWTVDIEGGDMDVVPEAGMAAGQSPRVVARIRIRAARQTRLARNATPAAGANGNANVAVNVNANAGAAPTRHRRALTPRERLALDTLLHVHVADPHGSQGLSAAAQVVEETVEDGPPMFYQIPIVGRRLVIAVDVSYSMREPDPTAHANDGSVPSKLDMLRAQLAKLLGALPPDIAIDIVAFSSDVQVLWSTPRVLDEASLVEAVRWVANLRPMDETHPLVAVQRAIDMQSDQVIMLTDGRPTYADSEEPALMRVAGGLQSTIRLDAVGIGPDQNATFLDALARRGHGIALHF